MQFADDRIRAISDAFEIRKLVPGAEDDDRRIQLTYDTVNRMVLLIGDVPFDRLFREPLRSLAEHVLPRFHEAERARLLDDAKAATAAFERLVSEDGELTLEELSCRDRHHVPVGIVESAVELRRHGIRIPLPGVGGVRRREALARLLATAPKLTFEDLFTKSAKDAGAETVSALHAVRRTGLLSWWTNDRCCAKGAGHDGVADLCSPNDRTWCNLTGQDEDTCSIGSDRCPPPKPPDPDPEA